MANAWKREKPSLFSTLPRFLLLLLVPSALIILLISRYSLPTSTTVSTPSKPYIAISQAETLTNPNSPIRPFDCLSSPQASPVFASLVEGVKTPFLYSLADFGNLPDKPHKNIARMLKGKRFRRPDISATVQEVLEGRIGGGGGGGGGGVVVDIGANVGMATFAAAVMGFKVLAFEPVFENLQRICDGVYLNRVGGLVAVFEAAASDRLGNITFHKLVGRLDNSAVSATGAKLAFKSNEEVAMEVKTVPLDDVLPDGERVVLIKIDVQGWEYHALRGASKLLSRKAEDAPYLIYEEDERLLQASNSSTEEIRGFLNSVGYHHCTKHGTDAHCTKK
ncbi:hypothetical protein QJS10_CPB13g00216 [Acorus calamus]|uniref:Methyltransferase FkbM domain-containing protein n=1 Tax=Acorus calamus TaxID=4465 RepID=A0AAV9DJM5_ACOCL|nr:hypothetical protein QJS10_CPB13g00216 [Acorus calamus]